MLQKSQTPKPSHITKPCYLIWGFLFLISTGAFFPSINRSLEDIKTKRTKLVPWRRIPARTWCLVMLPYYLNMRYNVPHNLTMHICSEKKRIYSDRSNDSLTAKCCLISETCLEHTTANKTTYHLVLAVRGSFWQKSSSIPP